MLRSPEMNYGTGEWEVSAKASSGWSYVVKTCGGGLLGWIRAEVWFWRNRRKFI